MLSRTKDFFQAFYHLDASLFEGVDFKIDFKQRDSNILLVAPHGGCVERGTDFLVRYIAEEQLSYYCFEGLNESIGWGLHVTSTRFFEDQLDELLADSSFVVTIHSCKKKGGIFLGGQNQRLIQNAIQIFKENGLKADKDIVYEGKHKNNICNRGAGLGLQLEIHKGYINEIMANTNLLKSFKKTVLDIIKRYE